jgi:hypothetical protein
MYDEVRRAYDDTAAVQGRLLGISERRYDTLLEKFTMLRMQGAAISVPEAVPQYAPASKPQAIDPEEEELKALVADQAGPDLRKRAIMLRQLKRDRLDGVSVEEIRKQIEQGVVADGVMA